MFLYPVSVDAGIGFFNLLKYNMDIALESRVEITGSQLLI